MGDYDDPLKCFLYIVIMYERAVRAVCQ